jgi:hypothetical protein
MICCFCKVERIYFALVYAYYCVSVAVATDYCARSSLSTIVCDVIANGNAFIANQTRKDGGTAMAHVTRQNQ